MFHRCEVRQPKAGARRGEVKFVGKTFFQSGIWVGIQYDEPVGKNDGRSVLFLTTVRKTRNCCGFQLMQELKPVNSCSLMLGGRGVISLQR